MTVTGAGSDNNPYVVTSLASSIQTGFDVQYNDSNVTTGVHRIDFRGSAVSVSAGVDEAVVTVTVPDPTSGAIIPTGAIWMFGMSTMPTGWLLCDGASYSTTTYANLFAAIGYTYGGSGASFNVPNLTDRFPVGRSGTKPLAGTGGAATKTIATANLPPHAHDMTHDHPAVSSSTDGGHRHSLDQSTADGSAPTMRRGQATVDFSGTGPFTSSDGNHNHSVNVANYVGSTGTVGSATPLDVMPPWLSLSFGVKT